MRARAWPSDPAVRLSEAGRVLASTLDTDDLLSTALDFATGPLGFERAAILLGEEDRAVLTLRARRGPRKGAGHPPDVAVPLSDPALAPLRDGTDPLVLGAGDAEGPLRALGRRLGFGEMRLHALGDDRRDPDGLLVAGRRCESRGLAPPRTAADGQGLAVLAAHLGAALKTVRAVEAVQRENGLLRERVQSLVRAEAALEGARHALDSQARVYRRLHELGKRLAQTFDRGEVVKLAASVAVQDLDFERCAVFLAREEGAGYAAAAFEGYGESPDAARVEGTVLPEDDPLLDLLRSRGDGVVCGEGTSDPVLVAQRGRLGLDDFVALPLSGDGERPDGLLIAGNRLAMRPFQALVERDAEAVLELSSLASQTTAALKAARFTAALEAERRMLERKVAERTQQLYDAKEAAESANRAKSAFLANMSHELRTPLNAIIGYSEMLREDGRTAGLAAFATDLEKINAAGHHLLSLVDDVLDLSKIEAGKMELFLEPFDVAAMVREVVDISQPLVLKNRNRLEASCSPSVGRMRADLTKVRQALFNLLSNACKFTQDGLIRLQVSRRGEGGAARVTFEVRDSGAGLTPEQMGRLFQSFSQADASTTRRFGGTGLGLALSRRLCQMMGGDVRVESEHGKGSTFTIDLPAEVSPAAGLPPEEPSPPPAPVEESEAPLVLVVDDDPSVREHLASFLSRDGYRVAAAQSAEEGLALAWRLCPDLVTLDVLMPGMDGWTVLSALKADPETASIPVVMLSMVDDRELGFALGAAEFVVKPIDRQRLRELVARHAGAPGRASALVVEDDAATRGLVRRILEEAGWAVVEAENGRAGVARAAARMPGLVVLDLVMPEMDGFEFLEELRRMPGGAAVPVVVSTAKDLTAADRRRLAGSVERVLQKGRSARADLRAVVREALANRARR